MRWPWQPKPETRSSGGDYSDRILRLYEADAAGTAADHGATAAVEAASGALSPCVRIREGGRAANTWSQSGYRAVYWRSVGRDVLRRGQSPCT